MKVPALLLAMVMLVHVAKAMDTWKRGQLEVHHRPSLLWKALWARAKSQFLKSPASIFGSNTFKNSPKLVNYRDYRRSVGKRTSEAMKTFGMPEVIQT